MVIGDRPDFGSIAFGVAAHGPEGSKVARVPVGEADLGIRHPVGIPNPNVEVLTLTARSE